jgi:biotin carboxyl carrier protein
MKMKIKVDDETYEIELGDLDSRPILAKVNGQTFEVYPEEVQAVMPVNPPLSSKPVTTAERVTPKPSPTAVSISGKSVLSPLPGVIDSIKIREGDEVKSGQELLVLEAMKMKNTIRATRDGKIERIYVSIGDQVSHNHVLLDFAD